MLNRKIFLVALEREYFYTVKQGIEEKIRGFSLMSIPTVDSLTETLKTTTPDIIMLSNDLPLNVNYLDVCRQIKQDNSDIIIIIMATQREKPGCLVNTLKSNVVDDYICNMACPEEIAARMNLHLKYITLQDEVRKKNVILRRDSIRDALTGLYNRRYISERLAHEISRSRRYQYPLSVLMIDIDHFKKINDTYGHSEGDKVLRTITKLLKRALRLSDFIGRYGGEEIIVFLPNTDLEGARIAAERLREGIAEYEYPVQNIKCSCTISVGIACYDGKVDINEKALIDLADKSLLKAKQTGRNKVCF